MSSESIAPDSGHGVTERWRGRGGLLIPAVLGTICTVAVIGLITMDVPEGTDFPGPRFFPGIMVVIGYLLTVLLTIHYLRHPDPKALQTEHRTYSDWQAIAWIVGGFLAFAILIDVLGWILAAGLLFWCVARAFGSTRPLFDVSVALVTSSGTYLVFAAVLDLTLPSGILGGL